MAIEKDIAIHGSAKSVINYVKNIEKTDLTAYEEDLSESDRIAQLHHSLDGMGDVEDVIEYASNLKKTVMELDGDKDILVSGVGCNHNTAMIEFAIDREKYYDTLGESVPKITGTVMDKKTGQIRNKQSIECYHVIQSFPKIEGLDPRLVHHIGMEYAEKAFPGHKCVVTTHMNTEHLHNHIVVCNYNSKEPRKFKMDKAKRHHIRKINDEISINYGLPILLDHEIDPSRGSSYLEVKASRNGDSWKDKIRSDIQLNVEISKSWDEYVRHMEESGYIVTQRGKYVTYSYNVGNINGKEYGERKIRDKTLGEDYMRDNIIKQFGNTPANEQPELESPDMEAPAVTHRKEQIHKEVQHISFHVDRYTRDGRRRSDIEMILLMAIEIIRYFMDRFFDREMYERTPDDPVLAPAKIKLQALEQSIKAAQYMGISTMDELQERMEYIKTIKYEEMSEILEKEYRNLQRLNSTVSLADDPIFLQGPLFTREEIEHTDIIETQEITDTVEPEEPWDITADSIPELEIESEPENDGSSGIRHRKSPDIDIDRM
ncbi:MAG: relaxase/mobilization nuclease domain-containing protein [Eubacterium sp.]|nr:relaxase/mobilization nuclease domain-containing protein [Eubacterium sp.]